METSEPIPPPVPNAVARCAECGKTFPSDEMIRQNNLFVCAGCKPIFFQKMAEGLMPGGSMPWRSGKSLVMPLAAQLPNRCVKCNAPATEPKILKRLFWHSPYVYLLILLNLLIYAVVAVIVRKRVNVLVPICESHRLKRKTAMTVAWLVALSGVGFIIAAMAFHIGWPVLPGVLCLLAALIYGVVKVTLVSAKRIDDRFVWLNGVCKDYLDTLPTWNGPG